MKSAKERAEELAVMSRRESVSCTNLRDAIAAQLEAYSEEIKTAKLEWAADESDRAYAEGRRAGRLEAIEEAAKVSETCITPEDCRDEHHDPRWCATCDSQEDAGMYVASKIRALAKGEGEATLPDTKDYFGNEIFPVEGKT